jgi:hypothetical protein
METPVGLQPANKVIDDAPGVPCEPGALAEQKLHDPVKRRAAGIFYTLPG